MRIRKEEFKEVLDFLNKASCEQGNEFVAFLNEPFPVSKAELHTFSTYYDVREFCYEMTTDRDTFGFLPIRSACGAMQDAINNRTLLIEEDGIIDISRMVDIRWEQLEKQRVYENLELTNHPKIVPSVNQKRAKVESERKVNHVCNDTKRRPRL